MSGCAIVAGAGSGIGAATAVSLAARETDVLAVSRQPERILELPLSEHHRDRLHPVAADLTDPLAVDQVFSRAEASLGPVGYVVHSVGHDYKVDWYRKATAEAIEAAIRTLIMSPALLLNRALRSMQSSGGTIGLVTSGAANKPTPGRALYSTSKIAMNRLIESVAVECEADEGELTVFGISPGRVDTPMQQRLIESAKDAPTAFGLESFLDTSNVGAAQDVGEAIADLIVSATPELNGKIVRYPFDIWS